MTSLRSTVLMLSLASCATLPPATFAQFDAPAPRAQLAADQRAYRMAHAIPDPAARLLALRGFVKDFPDSTRVSSAQSSIFALLVKHFPERAEDIDTQGKLMVKKKDKGLSKWRTEYDLAQTLADAEPQPVDLPSAEKWARDAVAELTEEHFDKEAAAMEKGSKYPAPTAAETHQRFVQTRADAVAALASVLLAEGRVEEATKYADEAFALLPRLDTINAVRGQLAFLAHRNGDALDSFERAQLTGALKPGYRDEMMKLFREAHQGSDASFEAELDTRYAQLYPAMFTPAKAQAAQAGHTVLLELFTGSACPPCVGGDEAVEGVLDAYGRDQVIALAYDLHIPEPDPLTNPDSVARAAVYDVGSTPSYVLDGRRLGNVYGGSRDASEKLYKELAKAIDKAAPTATGVSIQLHATPASDGTIAVHADVTLGDAAALEDHSPSAVATDAKAKTTPAPAVSTVAAAPRLTINFALVEDDIRYSGENGVRFHRMVVRALATSADHGYLVRPGIANAVDTTFNPEAISGKWSEYLDGFEKSNDRFSDVKFLTKQTGMRRGHLAIVAWVQESTSHRVLQSSFLPLRDLNASAEATK